MSIDLYGGWHQSDEDLIKTLVDSFDLDEFAVRRAVKKNGLVALRDALKYGFVCKENVLDLLGIGWSNTT